MAEFRLSQVLESEDLWKKFNSDKIKTTVLSEPRISAAMQWDTGIVLVCKEDSTQWKNESWTKKSWTYHTILLPYREIMALPEKEANQLVIQYITERLQQWEAKRRKR